MIKIKHNLSGEVKDCSELEHHMMMDSNDWTMIVEKPKPKPKKKSKKKSKKK
tara:strand:- start:33 stop:188 length:156 start_codon:yes stop_codon:yes gene_type:complete